MLRMARGLGGSQDTDLEREDRAGEGSKGNNRELGHWGLRLGEVGKLAGKDIVAVEAGPATKALGLLKASRPEGEEGTCPGGTWVA